MSFKETWKPRVDGVDDADSSAVNEIAEAVINNEENIENIDEKTYSKQEANTLFANALKGSASGEIVALKDVSPLEHNIGVRVSSKNLISSDIWSDLFDKQEDGSYLSNQLIYLDAAIRQFYLPPAVYTISYDVKCEVGKNYRIRLIYEDDSYIDNYTRSTGDYVHYENVTAEKAIKAIQWYYADLSQNVYFKNLQIEKGTTATAYTPYIADIEAVKVRAQGENGNIIEYTVSPDGTVDGVKSISPATTLTTDTEGVLIEVEYNKDANKVVATLEQRLAALEAAIISQ